LASSAAESLSYGTFGQFTNSLCTLLNETPPRGYSLFEIHTGLSKIRSLRTPVLTAVCGDIQLLILVPSTNEHHVEKPIEPGVTVVVDLHFKEDLSDPEVDQLARQMNEFAELVNAKVTKVKAYKGGSTHILIEISLLLYDILCLIAPKNISIVLIASEEH